MRLSSVLVVLLTFALAGLICLVAARFAVTIIEDNSEINVREALDARGHGWAEVEANGLQVILSGRAPDEATRFAAISTVGAVVDATRIIDSMTVEPSADLNPPRFSAEILRNESGISIIGLVPASTDRAALVARLGEIAGADTVTDLLEVANHPEPRGWRDALGFAATALERLPRAKISVDAGRVAITAISDSAEAKRAMETELKRAAPPDLRVALDIAAPRPVITPFTLRYIIDAQGGRFDACSAETEAARDRIIAAARDAGLTGAAACTLGMGVPSPRWADAAELGVRALFELGGGTITFSDADITLVAAQGTDHGLFDRIVGELEAELPEVFALHAVLPPPENSSSSVPPEFVATLSPEGLVQLRGRLSDENQRQMADSYAKAAFGSNNVYTAARIVADLPSDWPVRVLAGLEALSHLINGAVTVTPENVTVRGVSEQEDASARIARLLSAKLGESQNYTLDIALRAAPEAVESAQSPESCAAEIAAIQKTGKITFDPGSDDIAEGAIGTMDAIAEVLTECGDLELEIQGHTDSQGREEMNLELSRARAQSVLDELRSRRVPTANLTAVGYGETRPIAPNDTDEGREANRRIEFWLVRPEPIKETQTTLEARERKAATNGGTEAEKPGEEGTRNEQD